jgi:GTP pyrophosphokinase
MPELLSSYPENSIVRKAYAFAEDAHKDAKRASGDPYFTHCEAVAETVKEWGLDESSVAAALLHDVAEDTAITLADIEKRFGAEIASLVEGLTKLKELKYPEHDPQVENLRKFVVSFSRDLRVLLIKLADRLHNMQTVSSLPQGARERIAWETLEIYAPLAYRLGMQKLSGELEDLAFPFVYPTEYKWLTKTLGESHEERLRYALALKPAVLKALEEHGIRAVRIDARAKRLYSLYKKLLRHNMDLETIYDLVALRIVVQSVEDCYAALGVIHGVWPPLPNRFRDYIARPKQNGYRSLHTAVFCVDHKITEFQIRTEDMHEEAELGIAAHWAYQQVRNTKKGAKKWEGMRSMKELTWVEQLQNWQKTFTSHEEFVQSLKTDFFKDRIFVLTPESDVVDLPSGATPVDFAYRIHSDIGDTCIGAKVNGSIVQLDVELHSGDMVEILTQRGKKPSEGWLQFATTELARKHIRGMMNAKDRALQKKAAPGGVEFKLTNADRPGYLKDVTAVFGKAKVNIVFLNSQTDRRGTFATVTARCGALPSEKIEKLLVALRKIPDTKEASYRTSR